MTTWKESFLQNQTVVSLTLKEKHKCNLLARKLVFFMHFIPRRMNGQGNALDNIESINNTPRTLECYRNGSNLSTVETTAARIQIGILAVLTS
mgnify:CR=1 FL=1